MEKNKFYLNFNKEFMKEISFQIIPLLFSVLGINVNLNELIFIVFVY